MSPVTLFPRRLIPWVMASSVLSMSVVVRPADDARARQFIEEHEAKIRPLEKAVNLTWWNANVSGKDADFKAKEEAQNKLDEALASQEPFAELKTIKEGKPRDRLLAREINVLYLMYLEKQVEPALLKKITAKANAIEQAFNVFRAKVNDRAMTDSEVRKVLKESNDSAQRKKVWKASKAVGSVVDRDLKELVGLRNEAARKLGFRDYHVLQLYLNEQSQEQVLGLFDRLDELTREPFRRAKTEIDSKLAQNCGVSVDELRPWHYHDPFFQEPPAVFGTDLDAVYANVDILKVCKDYYAGIGLPVDDVIARSDLYEKPGKSPHAFCTDIDREGDVRVLANIVPNEYWMGTMLHELGHSVYSSKNIPRRVPYVLRTEAHILTTEGVAMMFERAAKSADWLQRMGVSVSSVISSGGRSGMFSSASCFAGGVQFSGSAERSCSSSAGLGTSISEASSLRSGVASAISRSTSARPSGAFSSPESGGSSPGSQPAWASSGIGGTGRKRSRL